MSKYNIKIIVVTGASGGHIFPAAGFLSALTELDPRVNILLVLPRKHIPIDTQWPQVKIRQVSIISFGRGPFGALRATLAFFLGTIESAYWLISFRPALVVGFGSLVTVPMVALARIFGIKTMIHEQNVLPGKANWFLAGIADRVALSFAGSADFLRAQKRKIALTGNPLRKQIFRVAQKEALDFFGFSSSRFTILVIGGSQGSRSLNRAFLDCCGRLKDKYPLQVIHLCGAGSQQELEEQYLRWSIPAKVFVFLEEMRYAYSAADLVLSRGGSAALWEIAYFGLPAVIVPYPYAQQHQMLNAGAMAKSGPASIVADDALLNAKLAQVMESFIRQGRPAKPLVYAGFFPDAAVRLADEAIRLVSGS